MKAEHKPGAAGGLSQAPIGDVLAKVGHELGQLSHHLGHIETLVGPLILQAARRDADLVRQIQDLDHIRQKVRALGDFLSRLARAAPDQCLVDASAAARAVSLADLAARLTSKDDSGSRAGEEGEFELF